MKQANCVVDSKKSQKAEEWFLKGQELGWQSSPENDRTPEAADCFVKAITTTKTIRKKVFQECLSLSLAIHEMRCRKFAEDPSESNQFEIADHLYGKTFLPVFIRCGIEPPGEFFEKQADLMFQAVCAAWRNVIGDQGVTPVSERERTSFQNRCSACKAMLSLAVGLSGDPEKHDIPIYRKNIEITTALLHTYDAMDNRVPGWCKEQCLDEIMFYHQQIQSIDSSYQIPPPSLLQSKGNKKGKPARRPGRPSVVIAVCAALAIALLLWTLFHFAL